MMQILILHPSQSLLISAQLLLLFSDLILPLLSCPVSTFTTWCRLFLLNREGHRLFRPHLCFCFLVFTLLLPSFQPTGSRILNLLRPPPLLIPTHAPPPTQPPTLPLPPCICLSQCIPSFVYLITSIHLFYLCLPPRGSSLGLCPSLLLLCTGPITQREKGELNKERNVFGGLI